MDALQAGRILYDTEMSEVLKIQERKIFDFITKCYDRYVVFDYDGTLTHMKYTDYDRILPCTDDGIKEYAKQADMYENCKGLKTMQFILERLDPEKVFILTHSFDEVIEGKNKSISRNYPTVIKSHIIHVNKKYGKVATMEMLYETIKDKTKGKKVLFVEDTLKALLDCEEQLDFVEGVHISTILA